MSQEAEMQANIEMREREIHRIEVKMKRMQEQLTVRRKKLKRTKRLLEQLRNKACQKEN